MSKKNLQAAMKNRNPLATKPPTIKPVDLYGGDDKKESLSQESPKVQKEKMTEKPKKTETAVDQLYTTYIRKDQKKKIKLHALETDKHDKEIVQEALDEYFKNHSL